MKNYNLKYDERMIEKIYQENLSHAQEMLASLEVAEGRKPDTKSLSGWVYEQTIRYCLSKELKALGLSPVIKEQVPLYGRVKIDLLVDKVTIEIKSRGVFSKNTERYKRYRAKVEERGWVYFYLTRREGYAPYRSILESVFGKDKSFFLDKEGEWERFVKEVVKHLEKNENHKRSFINLYFYFLIQVFLLVILNTGKYFSFVYEPLSSPPAPLLYTFKFSKV